MRQLKFRIWSKKYQLFDSDPKWPNNQYSYDRRFLDSNGNVVIFVDYNGYSLFEDEEKDLIVQFSTGLKDKTGREIYEGDIIKLCNSYNHGFERKGKISEVLWSDSELCYFLGKGNLRLTKNKKVEIIGNILENSELLKK